MKYLLLPLVTGLLLLSCSSPTTPSNPKNARRAPYIAEKDYPADKIPPIDIPPAPAPDMGKQIYCYELHEGENGKDITTMKITIQNDSVSGTMDYVPFKRDEAHGKLSGRKEGKFLELTYTYTTEGQRQVEEMEFKMEKDKIYKKDGELVLKDSVLVLKDPSRAVFSLEMERVKCR